MLRSQRRLLYLLLALPVLLVAAAVVYQVGMEQFEGKTRTFWQSFEFAAETLSTTGYGEDGSWSHPAMVIFVVVLQFLGVFLIFLIFPIYLIPFLEERFEARLPKAVTGMRDHVVIYRYGPAVASLVDELRKARIGSVIIEEETGPARRDVERGIPTVLGRLADDVLERVGLLEARALVANGSDDENAAAILVARGLGFEGDILAVVEEPYHRKPMVLAGATAVYTPRHILGAALAARASERISPRVEGAQLLGRKLVVSEVRIERDSEMAARTLGEVDVGRRTGVTVLGQWSGGKLIAPPGADMRLESDGILIVAGSSESVQRLEEVCAGARRLRRTGGFVLAGNGEVGSKAAELLRQVGETVKVIDRCPGQGVDLVGDILDYRILEISEVSSAQAIILAVDSDSATLFATVIIKDFAPAVPVIARVNHADNVERIHRAGADYALSISQVSGRMLAGKLLGQEAISVDAKLRVSKVGAAALAGKHPAELDVRQKAGVSIVAVERDDEVLVDFDPEFRFAAADDVYICGSDEATQRYLELFPAATG